MVANDINQLSDQQHALIQDAENKALLSIGTSNYWFDVESLADVLDQLGLHEQSRQKYKEIIGAEKDLLCKSRCHRKIISSFISQRDFNHATQSVEEAIDTARLLVLANQECIEEYLRIQVEAGFVFYFIYQPEKVDAVTKELKRWQDRIEDPGLRISFMNITCLSLLIRYRWYKVPEEAFTHAEFFLHQAHSTGDPFTVSMALCNKGFNHLWNEEVNASRKCFMEVINLLQDKNYSPLLMACNYVTVGYRMQNNISITEQWANLTLERAIRTENLSYLHYAYANLAWVNAKRSNWLYAEDYARKAMDRWNSLPLFFSYAFILMECLLRKRELDEAGKYAYMLLHPKAKKLPDSIVQNLQLAVSSWIREDENGLQYNLTETLSEAKITGYY